MIRWAIECRSASPRPRCGQRARRSWITGCNRLGSNAANASAVVERAMRLRASWPRKSPQPSTRRSERAIGSKNARSSPEHQLVGVEFGVAVNMRIAQPSQVLAKRLAGVRQRHPLIARVGLKVWRRRLHRRRLCHQQARSATSNCCYCRRRELPDSSGWKPVSHQCGLHRLIKHALRHRLIQFREASLPKGFRQPWSEIGLDVANYSRCERQIYHCEVRAAFQSGLRLGVRVW